MKNLYYRSETLRSVRLVLGEGEASAQSDSHLVRVGPFASGHRARNAATTRRVSSANPTLIRRWSSRPGLLK